MDCIDWVDRWTVQIALAGGLYRLGLQVGCIYCVGRWAVYIVLAGGCIDWVDRWAV